MTTELSPAEQAAEKVRKQQLADEMAQMDDVELGLLAKRAEIDASQYPKREDLIAAIELKAEKDAADGRRALREEDERQKKFVDEEDAKRTPPGRAVRALNVEFCRAVPDEAWAGTFVPSEDHPRFGGEYAVPNGRYRVVGSQFIFEFKGKRLVGAFTATPDNKWGGDKVIPVE